MSSWSRYGVVAAVLALLAGLLGLPTTASAVAPPLLQTDMNVLVVTGPETQPYENLMDRDGIKCTATTTAGITPRTWLSPLRAEPRTPSSRQ